MSLLPIVYGKPVHSLETIKEKLNEDPRNIDAGIAILGEVGIFNDIDNFTYLKLYQFVTGIELSSGKQKWPPKSLQHPNAEKLFKYDCQQFEVSSPLELGFDLCISLWDRLGPLLDNNYEPPNLNKEKQHRPQKTIALQCVVIDALKGKGVKFIFNGKSYWVPRSIIKYSYEDETLEVPLWYAKKENLI